MDTIEKHFVTFLSPGMVDPSKERLARAGITLAERVAQLEMALREIANMPSHECARDPFLCKALARNAMSGEPSGMEIAQREAEEAAGDNDPRDQPIDL